jgi:hypothetical protein
VILLSLIAQPPFKNKFYTAIFLTASGAAQKTDKIEVVISNNPSKLTSLSPPSP